MLTAEQKKLLEAPLPRDVIRTLTAKGSVDYVDGWYIIGRLNEVFGVDGWAATYGAPTVREGQRPCIYVPASLTVAGVTKHDIGVGVAANESADSFETAIKGAYTDGLKRCARLLGDSFGLALYEKVKGTQKRSGVGMATTTLAYLEEVDSAPTLDALAHWVDAHLDALKAIPDDEKRAVRDAVKARRLELQEAAMEPAQLGAPAPQLAAPQSTAPQTAQTAANDRPSTPPAPVEAPANPAASEALSAATRRLAVARTITTVTAIVRGAPVQSIERTALWALTLGATLRLGATEAALRESLARADSHGATVAQWGLVATVLVALDSCTSAAGIEAVRQQHGATVATLPAPLLAGVKAATAERARELGAPTVASRLKAAATAARDEAGLQAVHARLVAACDARQVVKAEVDEITAALNARAEALAASVAA
jgi:hypothetical protein